MWNRLIGRQSGTHRLTHGAIVIPILMVVAIVITSCGGQTSGVGTNGQKASAAFDAKVHQDITHLQGSQSTAPPMTGPRAVPGKSLIVVAITLQDGGAKRVTQGFTDAAHLLGWHAQVFDARGDPTAANADLQRAATLKPDGIAVVGLEASFISTGLKAASDAHIPVVCGVCWDLSDTKNYTGQYLKFAGPPLTAFYNMGYADAEFSYVKTGGHPRFLVLNDPSLANLNWREKGLNAFIHDCTSAGGDCKIVGATQFQLAAMTTDLPGQAAALARAHPDFNALWVSFDSAALFAINGLQQAGLADTTKSFAVSGNADPPNLKQVSTGSYLAATAGFGLEWNSYGLLDNLNRFFAGQPPVDQHVPVRLFVQNNVPSSDIWTGDVDFVSTYRNIWQGA